MDRLSRSAFWCSGGEGRGGGGEGGSRLYAVCLFCCLCLSAAVVAAQTAGAPVARPPPPMYASNPTKGVIDSSLYYPADAQCLMAAIKKFATAVIVRDRTKAATLLRLVFHDCMTTGGGCEASILSDGEINNPVNADLKRVVPDINTIRDQAGRECGVLPTLADTIARAAAAAVTFTGLNDVVSSGFQLGRRDLAPNQPGNEPTTLPNENQSLDAILTLFATFGLTAKESTVWAIGGHSIGVADCAHFSSRLSNVSTFPGCLRPADPTLDPSLACRLARQCSIQDIRLPFDFVTPFSLDTSYFQLLLKKQGLLKSDQAFSAHPRTSAFIRQYATFPGLFSGDFLKAFVKVSLFNVNSPQTAPPTQYYYP